MQQQLSPIWDAIDEEQFSYALQLIEKTQKRYRSPNQTLLGLKGLCLARENQIADALTVCESLRKLAPEDNDTYQTIQSILKTSLAVEVVDYLMLTLENAFRNYKSEFLAHLWFMEAVRTGRYQAQRKAAVELQKGFLSRDYFFLVVQSMLVIYTRTSDPKEKSLLGMLMHRMITKASSVVVSDDLGKTEPINAAYIKTNEEFYLYLEILLQLKKPEEALAALNGPHGKKHGNNLEFRLIKVDILTRLGHWQQLFDATKSYVEEGLDDWQILKALVYSNHRKDSGSNVDGLLEILRPLPQSRNTYLAQVYAFSLTQDKTALYEALKQFLGRYVDKLSTYEDLAQYINMLSTGHANRLLLDVSKIEATSNISQVLVATNIAKYRILTGELGAAEAEFIRHCFKEYTAALSLGKDLKETDNHYGDDLLLIGVLQLIAKQSANIGMKHQAIVLLEHGLQNSKHNFQFRLLLIELYRTVGAWNSAFQHFQALQIKHIQRDTLSYILLENSKYEYVSTMQINSLLNSQNIYYANQQETPDMLCQAYENRTYSKIVEFMDFQERLTKSVWWVESNLEIWSIRILLDKFDYSTRFNTEVLQDVLHDNKSRNVMLDLQAPLASTEKSGSKLSPTDLLSHRISFRKVQIMQAIIQKDETFVTVKEVAEDQDPITRMLEALYSAWQSQLSNEVLLKVLDSVLEDVLVCETDGFRFDRQILVRHATLVSFLKSYSLLCKHLSRLRLDLFTRKVREIVEQSKRRLEEYRQLIHVENSESAWYSVLGITEEFATSVTHKTLSSQREGLTCLLGVLKSIKL